MTGLTRGQIAAKQLAHNAIEGQDNDQLLAEIYRQIEDAVSQGKGKSAIHLARVYGEGKRNFVGQHFWARGFFVSTVGRDETVVRDHIRNEEQED